MEQFLNITSGFVSVMDLMNDTKKSCPSRLLDCEAWCRGIKQFNSIPLNTLKIIQCLKRCFFKKLRGYSDSDRNMSASLTRITRQVSRTFDLNVFICEMKKFHEGI